MRILVVEDDRLLNNTLCYNLDTAGYVVDSALTKSAASNFLTKQDYDLIVLDVNLPDGNVPQRSTAPQDKHPERLAYKIDGVHAGGRLNADEAIQLQGQKPSA